MDTFTNFELFQNSLSILEQLKYVQNTIVADYYSNTPEMDLITSDALVNEIVGSARAV